MLSVHRTIPASPEAAWQLLVDLDEWPKWGPSISGAELDPLYAELAQGATGMVQTSLLVRAPFLVTDFEPGKFWAWKVAGIPATSHRVEATENGARVTFSVPWWASAYLTVCVLALYRIEKLLLAAD